ncbi:UDP-glucuronosyltransferase 1-3-like [Contarinia nasturtii]|uniref:UDP-glucuronosyltransferase 1-3-like n=1 Tax=Contarinia nasturtii TaxID=265458 RepID=UPI0012D3F8A0|nr:UDP-glucuronosyltransferase 1-3-like [Contarinia nasturtii]XP_031635701.1 UDP-glucuronosyltransferase 1-3-like [Contarinia nasturtii]
MKVEIVLMFVLAISTTSSLNILGLFPYPGESHFKFFHPIMRGLADAGHKVTVVSHFPDKNAPENYNDLLLTKTTLDRNSLTLKEFKNESWFKNYQNFFLLNKMGIKTCEIAFNSTSVQKILNTKPKYDVILLEQFNNDCMVAIAWKIQAPVIALSSCLLMPWHYDRFGNPLIPSYIPALFTAYTDKMNFIERLNNWITVNVLKLMYHYIAMPATDEIIQKYMKNDNIPAISELVKETSLMFTNSHYSLSGSRPNVPNVIELGGIHIKEEQPLDAELKTFLDSATDGVIYVSWGSKVLASSLPDQKRESLLKAFGSLKQKILWKFENDALPNQPENVFIRKWLPQRDILCHPNVRVFMSHGGLMGLSEAVYCGVPQVITPFGGDQFLNAAAAKTRGIGVIVQYEDITEDNIRRAINSALSSEALQNAKTVSYSFRNRPKTLLDTAVWWVEYVAETRGAPLLKSHSTNSSAFIYYSFDIYITIATVFIAITVLFIYIVGNICKRMKKLKTD